jgi:glucosamine--fructose-6-phosphate aminotransferase (isomerizing)
MCGIVGYVGPKKALPILMSGLKRLEYRGYDSAGIALLTEGGLMVAKSAGKIARLEETLGDTDYDCTHGIAHTRWATHGEPTPIRTPTRSVKSPWFTTALLKTFALSGSF